MRKKVAVSIILQAGENHVCLAPRRNPKDNPNTLGFPGGKRRATEPPIVAALRELKEETNIEARPAELKRIAVVKECNQHHGEYLLYVFALELGNRKPQQTEPAKLGRWKPLPIHQVLKMPEEKLLSGTKRALELLLAGEAMAA